MRKQDKEKTKGKGRRLVNRRKFWLWLIIVISLLMPKGGIEDLAYAGEFGGFDVDIGTDEGIFDNWDEEPEMEEPKGDEPEADQETSLPEEENKGGMGENEESPDNSGMENIQEKTENRPDAANRNTGENLDGSFSENNDSKEQSSSKNEEKAQDNPAVKSESANREKNVPARKKTKKAKIKITESPKKEIREAPSKFAASGMAFTAVGMVEISLRPENNNNNNENVEEGLKIGEKNNETIEFEHIKTVPAKEYPEIKMIRSTEEMDVTILSLCLNGEEVFWHQQGDKIIFDQPVTAEKNRVKLLAVIDGNRIVEMPVWEF